MKTMLKGKLQTSLAPLPRLTPGTRPRGLPGLPMNWQAFLWVVILNRIDCKRRATLR
jgi:hypothetical protein